MTKSTKSHQISHRDFLFSINDSKGVSYDFRNLHWHKEMEICHIKEGCGKYLINGREYVFGKGDVFIINNDEIHLCFDDRDLIIQVIMFDPSFIWTGGVNILDYEYLKPFLETESNFCNKLEQGNGKIHLIISTLLEIEDEYKSMRTGYELMIKSLLLKLMTLIIRYFKINNEKNETVAVCSKASQKMRMVVEYIESNYFKQLKISELAGIAQMSVPYFCNTFKTLAVVPPMDFIIRKRISVAKEELKNTNKKVLDIAEECGFNSISNFNHLFKSYIGLSPSEYRKS